MTYAFRVTWFFFTIILAECGDKYVLILKYLFNRNWNDYRIPCCNIPVWNLVCHIIGRTMRVTEYGMWLEKTSTVTAGWTQYQTCPQHLITRMWINKKEETSGQLARMGQITAQRTASTHGRDTTSLANPSRKRELGKTIWLNCNWNTILNKWRAFHGLNWLSIG